MRKKKSKLYLHVHYFLKARYGKPTKCENKDCEGKSKIYDWAIIKGKKLEKNRDNYRTLCRSCHVKYDWDEKKNKRMDIIRTIKETEIKRLKALRKSLAGKPRPDIVKRKIGISVRRAYESQEVRKKISDINKGRIRPPEEIKKVMESIKRNKTKNLWQLDVQGNKINSYRSIYQAYTKDKYDGDSIRKAIKENSIYRGYKWMLIERDFV